MDRCEHGGGLGVVHHIRGRPEATRVEAEERRLRLDSAEDCVEDAAAAAAAAAAVAAAALVSVHAAVYVGARGEAHGLGGGEHVGEERYHASTISHYITCIMPHCAHELSSKDVFPSSSLPLALLHSSLPLALLLSLSPGASALTRCEYSVVGGRSPSCGGSLAGMVVGGQE